MHPALLVVFRRPGTVVIAPLSIAQSSLCKIKTGLLSPRFGSSYGLGLHLDPAVKVPSESGSNESRKDQNSLETGRTSKNGLRLSDANSASINDLLLPFLLFAFPRSTSFLSSFDKIIRPSTLSFGGLLIINTPLRLLRCLLP